MDEIFLVRMGEDGDDEQARRKAERRGIHDRYLRHLVDATGIDTATAHRVMATLFEHPDGRDCPCGCHPRLSTLHDAGFDCPCGWDAARRAEKRRALTAFWDSPAAQELRNEHDQEESAIARWLAEQPGVEARRTTSLAPEQWEGTVDGHTFYFRERGGCWRLELDLEPTGRFAEKLTGVREDGEPATEPVEILEGAVIAEGVESQLGNDPVEHITFIVRTIRDHLWSRRCDHFGALFFCPQCGERMNRLPSE